MTDPKKSAIRCTEHAALCAHCWQKPYDPATGYCAPCMAHFVQNQQAFYIPAPPPAPALTARDERVLRELEEFSVANAHML